jgi:two-component sensor histidine kinase
VNPRAPQSGTDAPSDPADQDGSTDPTARLTSRMPARWADALAPRRRLATTGAGVEMALVIAFLSLRAVNVLQVSVSLPSGLTHTAHPARELALLVVFYAETAALVVAGLRRGRLDRPRDAVLDTVTGCVLLLGQLLTTVVGDRLNTWHAWGYAVTLSCALLAGFALPRRRDTAFAAAALIGCYLAFCLPQTWGTDQAWTGATNAIGYVAFAVMGRFTAGYLRRLGADADTARAQAATAAAQAERERHRDLLHDQATVLQLVGQNLGNPRLDEALRRQAAVGANRISSFMRDEPRATGGPRTLQAVLQEAAAHFGDLPLTCNADLVRTVSVTDEVAQAVTNAVTTLLHNVRRHAAASSAVVHGDRDEARHSWEIVVSDDGVGFDTGTAPIGYGLANQVRASLRGVGVEVEVRSAPGEGTTVTLTGPASPPGPPPRESPGAAPAPRAPS